ncbi:MAG: ThiF family adenylyltransferase [Verrucomicrobiota bacterium]
MKPNSSPDSRRRSPAHGVPCVGAHLVVLGVGGNIGSHLIPLLARLPRVKRLTLVDCGRYEKKNLLSQAINRSDIGQPKARVQARRVRGINPRLELVSIVDRLENVPLGYLRGDVILACLDSKESRRCANEISWRLGVPWIDAGVEPSLMLARVNVYLPAWDQPCLECGWSERDYAELATLHPCDDVVAKTPATNSPACLGALAAALQAIECQKLMAGQTAGALIGRQVLIDAATHKHFVTTFRRNPECRFDHATWKISALCQMPQDLSIGATLQLAHRSKIPAALMFGGIPLVKRLDCPGCGFSLRVFRLQSRLRKAEHFCARCGRQMLSAGFHIKTRLSRADLGPGDADRSLSSLGLRAGDVISLSNGADDKFFELGTGIPSRPRTTKPVHRRHS